MAAFAPLSHGRRRLRQCRLGLPPPVTAVALQREHIVATPVEDRLSHVDMAVERVRRDDFVRQIKQFHHLQRRLDLVLLGPWRHRREAQPGFGGRGGHRQWRAAACPSA